MRFNGRQLFKLIGFVDFVCSFVFSFLVRVAKCSYGATTILKYPGILDLDIFLTNSRI